MVGQYVSLPRREEGEKKAIRGPIRKNSLSETNSLGLRRGVHTFKGLPTGGDPELTVRATIHRQEWVRRLPVPQPECDR
jgi:hypothetical protein